MVLGRTFIYIIRSQFAVSFGEVTNWERRHSSEGVTGHLVASGKEASGVRGARVLGRRFSRVFLGRLSFRPGPSVLGQAEFWAWPLGWAGWLGEPSPSPWYPQRPPFSCRGGRSSPVGKKRNKLDRHIIGNSRPSMLLNFNVNFVTFLKLH